jgi:hypothetical protein
VTPVASQSAVGDARPSPELHDSSMARSSRPAVRPDAHPLRRLYLDHALPSVARILSLMDRDEFSPTYGCIDREYWLCRTTDFPSAIAQYGVHSLALCWAYDMPDNIYHGQPKVLAWTLAGLDYLTRIQHRDGSFDEFYPNERGWAGPTGFLTYAAVESYRLVKDHMSLGQRERLCRMVGRAGRYLYRRDEPGVLANHHAMAILPIREAYDLLGTPKLLAGFRVRLEDFLRHTREEGWCLEYDGADPGYLSATVSFLAKLRRLYCDERLDEVLRKAIEFSSYFVYPDGHYGGTLGSRGTLHFYPHGYELLGDRIPLAHAMADAMLRGLEGGALVPPGIQEDRYFLYRTPEYLLSYIDFGARRAELPPLPHERRPFTKVFPVARCVVRRTRAYYACINAAKGGVLKVFDAESGELLHNDAGIIARLGDGSVVTSQWIDPHYDVELGEDEVTIAGATHRVVTRRFTPWTFLLFRVWILSVGWRAALANRAKGFIRRLLMLGSRPTPLRFTRRIHMDEESVCIETTMRADRGTRVTRLRIGDEFHVRYVPQSRYFQPQELLSRGRTLTNDELNRINRGQPVTVTERIEAR